jgi:plasmid stabilization system protein ParE
MTFTVTWSPKAKWTLAGLWNDAADRQAMRDAADTIDVLLRTGPLDVGESRVANVRILTVLPLTVYYDVREADRLVSVWAVWRVRQG